MLQNIQNSNNEAVSLETSIAKVFQQVVEGSSELAASRIRQQDLSNEFAANLQSSLENMRNDEVRALLSVFGNIHSQLVSGKSLRNE